MTKEEYREQEEKLLMEELNEKDINEILNELSYQIEELRRMYKKSLIEQRKKVK